MHFWAMLKHNSNIHRIALIWISHWFHLFSDYIYKECGLIFKAEYRIIQTESMTHRLFINDCFETQKAWYSAYIYFTLSWIYFIATTNWPVHGARCLFFFAWRIKYTHDHLVYVYTMRLEPIVNGEQYVVASLTVEIRSRQVPKCDQSSRMR